MPLILPLQLPFPACGPAPPGGLEGLRTGRAPLQTGTAAADSDGSGSWTRSAPGRTAARAGSMVLLIPCLPTKRCERGAEQKLPRAHVCVCACACVCVCVCMRVRVCVTPRPESRLRAVTATPVAGSGPHQAGSLMLVPWPKPSSVNVGDETLAPKRRETRVLWTRDFNREDSEQYLASSLASSSSSTSLMSERCRHGHLGPGTGDGSSARGPTWVLSDRRAPVSPRKKGVMNGGQRGQLGPSSTPRPGCWGMRVPVKIQK